MKSYGLGTFIILGIPALLLLYGGYAEQWLCAWLAVGYVLVWFFMAMDENRKLTARLKGTDAMRSEAMPQVGNSDEYMA